jgi:surfeit locus 1 family protein
VNVVQETSSLVQFRFSLNWKITFVAALALPLLLSLGFWQLDRAAEKRAIEASFAARQSAPPVELTRDNLGQQEPFQRIIARGQFDNEHTWLLDNKQRRGQVGYEVVSPFQLNDGAWILVNRGWVKGTGDRRQLPEVPPLVGERSVFAEMAEVYRHPMLDASSMTEEWPRVVMAIEIKGMAEQLGRPLADRYLRISETSPGAFETGWQAVNMSAHTHVGYAFQWFAMSLALVVWFVFANSNLLPWWRSRRSMK